MLLVPGHMLAMNSVELALAMRNAAREPSEAQRTRMKEYYRQRRAREEATGKVRRPPGRPRLTQEQRRERLVALMASFDHVDTPQPPPITQGP